MTKTVLPVFLKVDRPDGTHELRQVGTALSDADGFVVGLDPVAVKAMPAPTPKLEPLPAAVLAACRNEDAEALEAIAERARKTITDPAKAAWHEKERELLRKVEAELLWLMTPDDAA